jgi:hypothetical protein
MELSVGSLFGRGVPTFESCSRTFPEGRAIQSSHFIIGTIVRFLCVYPLRLARLAALSFILLTAQGPTPAAAPEVRQQILNEPDRGMLPRCNNGDLLSGLAPVVGPRGLQHKADFDIRLMTDGESTDSARSLIVADYQPPGGGTSATLTFMLHKPADIAAIRVYSMYGDARAFQNYDVEYSAGYSGQFIPLVREVRTGKVGDRLSLPAKTEFYGMTEIRSSSAAPLANLVTQIRFTFWGGGHSNGNAHLIADRREARWGTAITEIDVLDKVPPDPVDLRQEPN